MQARPSMPDYSIFGGCLRSELSFPELRPIVAAVPRWTLRLTSALDDHAGDIIGEIPDSPCSITLQRSDSGFRLRHSCTGQFDISRDGSSITCAPVAAAAPESLRYDIAGRVMSVVLHAGGALCLHASAVQISGKVIAFVAPKRYGKSTLASALMGAGARLVTDDMLAVELSPRISALPGIVGLRLRDDAAQRILSSDMRSRRGVDGKHVFEGLAHDRVMLKRAPLSAIYVLAPQRPDILPSALMRTLLPPRVAAMSIVQHAKIGSLLGGSEGAVVLHRAAILATSVPVFQLEIVRDLARLNKVVDRMLGWHQAGFVSTSNDENRQRVPCHVAAG
jgi:hypothetical protein